MKNSNTNYKKLIIENPYKEGEKIDIGPLLEIYEFYFDSSWFDIGETIEDFYDFIVVEHEFEGINGEEYNRLKKGLFILSKLKNSFKRMAKEHIRLEINNRLKAV